MIEALQPRFVGLADKLILFLKESITNTNSKTVYLVLSHWQRSESTGTNLLLSGSLTFTEESVIDREKNLGSVILDPALAKLLALELQRACTSLTRERSVNTIIKFANTAFPKPDNSLSVGSIELDGKISEIRIVHKGITLYYED